MARFIARDKRRALSRSRSEKAHQQPSHEISRRTAAAVNGKDRNRSNRLQWHRLKHSQFIRLRQIKRDHHRCIEHTDKLADCTVLHRIASGSFVRFNGRLRRAVIAGRSGHRLSDVARICNGITRAMRRARTRNADRASLMAWHNNAKPQAEDTNQQNAKTTRLHDASITSVVSLAIAAS